jgi:hypothetical protein
MESTEKQVLPNLPHGDAATVDMRKLTEYALNPNHPKGGADKARVFASVLGLTAEHAEMLRDALLKAAREEEAVAYPPDQHGQRYAVYFDMTGPNGKTARITSAWRIDPGGEVPRLVSCYIEV